MTSVTASKIAHGNKFCVLLIVIILGFTFPQFFLCQPEIPYFFRIENAKVMGVPNFIAAILNIAVSTYLLVKIIKKKRSISSSDQVGYQVDGDRVFINIPAPVSKQEQNAEDMVVEDIEDEEQANSRPDSSVDSKIDSKIDSQVDSNVEPQVDSKVDPQLDSNVDQQDNTNDDQRSDSNRYN